MAENTVKASLSNYRVSAQKARLVANQIRGKGVEEAQQNACPISIIMKPHHREPSMCP